MVTVRSMASIVVRRRRPADHGELAERLTGPHQAVRVDVTGLRSATGDDASLDDEVHRVRGIALVADDLAGPVGVGGAGASTARWSSGRSPSGGARSGSSGRPPGRRRSRRTLRVSPRAQTEGRHGIVGTGGRRGPGGPHEGALHDDHDHSAARAETSPTTTRASSARAPGLELGVRVRRCVSAARSGLTWHQAFIGALIHSASIAP